MTLQQRFDAGEVVSLAGHWRGLTMFAAPTILHRLIRQPGLGPLPGFKTFVYGGRQVAQLSI